MEKCWNLKMPILKILVEGKLEQLLLESFWKNLHHIPGFTWILLALPLSNREMDTELLVELELV